MATEDTLPPGLGDAYSKFLSGMFLPRPNTPAVSNAGMYPSPNSPYNSLSDQIKDAFITGGILPGRQQNPFTGWNMGRYRTGWNAKGQPWGGGWPTGNGGAPTAGGPFTGLPPPPPPGTPMIRPGAPVAPGTPPPVTGGPGQRPTPGLPPGGPFQQPGSRTGAGGPPPAGGGKRTLDGSSGANQGANTSYAQGLLSNWQKGQEFMGADEKARLGPQVTSQGLWNPGGGDEDIGNLQSIFDSLDDQGRADFTNALGQYKPQLASALQIAGRAKMGQGAYDNWYSGVQNKQGSNFSTSSFASKAPWLAAAFK